MRTNPQLKNWIGTLTRHLPHLSKPQARVLALWSFGMVMAQSSGLTTVATFLAHLLDQKPNTVRQRLREWYQSAADKKGKKRQALNVTTCFAPLLQWILSGWPPQEQHLALALDATTLGQRFTVLAISVLYRGCAIPVAWKVVKATEPGAWQPHWLKLFDHIRGSVPSDWTVIVSADRGLYADWLYTQIVSLGWHPMLRINLGGTFCLEGESEFRPLKSVVPGVGSSWCGRVTCFKSNPLSCTVLARWDSGHAEPWLIVTDLAPQQADASWYALRSWIECGFKDTKSDGWQWQKTRMDDPNRAERHWLALAVATLWVVSVGGEVDATKPTSSFEELPPNHVAKRRTQKPKPPRLLSCFCLGLIVIVSALVNGSHLPNGGFYPEPWPGERVVVPPAPT